MVLIHNNSDILHYFWTAPWRRKCGNFKKKLGIKKKATKSVILRTISSTFKFATVWNLALQKITYTVLQQSGYKYVFWLGGSHNWSFEFFYVEKLSFSELHISIANRVYRKKNSFFGVLKPPPYRRFPPLLILFWIL
jgi:hypothetical protein